MPRAALVSLVLLLSTLAATSHGRKEVPRLARCAAAPRLGRPQSFWLRLCSLVGDGLALLLGPWSWSWWGPLLTEGELRLRQRQQKRREEELGAEAAKLLLQVSAAAAVVLVFRAALDHAGRQLSARALPRLPQLLGLGPQRAGRPETGA